MDQSKKRALTGRLAGLDGLRGILALSVACSHTFGHMLGWGNNYSPFRNASYAVDIFFVLSGIVLYHAYKKRFSTHRWASLQFLTTRFVRLWPIHVLTIALVFTVFLLREGILLPGWIKLHSLHGFFLDVSLLSSIGIFGDYGAVNQPSWSISVEMWVGSILMILLIKEWRWSFALIAAAMAVCVFGVFRPTGGASPIAFFLSSGAWRCVLAIPLGVLSYKLVTRFPDKLPSSVINFLAATVVVITFALVIGYKPTGITYVALTVLLGILMMCIPVSTGWALALLETRPIKRLGEISFCLYLIHSPIVYAFLELKSDNLATNIMLSHISIVASIIAAKYCHELVERRISYRWRARRLDESGWPERQAKGNATPS